MGGFRRCCECGAEICYTCKSVHPEDTGGDSTDYICKSCMKVFRQYEQEIQELRDIIDNVEAAREKLYKEKRKELNEINKAKLPNSNKA